MPAQSYLVYREQKVTLQHGAVNDRVTDALVVVGAIDTDIPEWNVLKEWATEPGRYWLRFDAGGFEVFHAYDVTIEQLVVVSRVEPKPVPDQEVADPAVA